MAGMCARRPAKLQNSADVRDVEYLESSLPSIKVALSVYTLHFIKRADAFSAAAAAFAGELLGLRPIISIIDGGDCPPAKVKEVWR